MTFIIHTPKDYQRPWEGTTVQRLDNIKVGDTVTMRDNRPEPFAVLSCPADGVVVLNILPRTSH